MAEAKRSGPLAWAKPWVWVGVAGLFSLSRVSDRFLTSDQNTYFAHAFAQAGVGFVAHDWFAAETLDPYPAFTLLLVGLLKAGGAVAVALAFALLCGLYAVGVVIIAALASRRLQNTAGVVAVGLALTGLHATFLNEVTRKLTRIAVEGYLNWSPSSHYVIGTHFKPNEFAMLLVLAAGLALTRHLALAAVVIGVVATMHQAQLVAGGMLTAGLMVATYRETRSVKRTVGFGALTLLLVLPVTLYARALFAATTPALLAEAQHLFVHERIPHHTQVLEFSLGRWAFSLTWIGLGIVLARKSAVGVVMGVALALSLSLTGVQLFTKSDALALMFPWRPLALLQAMATAVVVGAVVARLMFDEAGRLRIANEKVARLAAVCVAAVLVVTGVERQWSRLSEKRNDYTAVVGWVAAHRAEGERYLVPPIQVFESLRLRAGVPVYADWKNHPYKDVEFLEWDRRRRVNEAFYARLPSMTCEEVAGEMRALGQNRLIIERATTTIGEANCGALVKRYENDSFAVYAAAGP